MNERARPYRAGLDIHKPENDPRSRGIKKLACVVVHQCKQHGGAYDRRFFAERQKVREDAPTEEEFLTHRRNKSR